MIQAANGNEAMQHKGWNAKDIEDVYSAVVQRRCDTVTF